MADNPNEQRPEDDEQRLQGTDNDYDDPNMVVRAEQIVQSVGRPLEGLEGMTDHVVLLMYMPLTYSSCSRTLR